MSSLVQVPFNVSLPHVSSLFTFAPVRDTDVSLGWNSSYTGSTVWPFPPNVENKLQGVGDPFRATRVAGAIASITFDGTAAYLCVTDNGAPHTFTVDGQPVSKASAPASSDVACKNTGAETLLVADGLQYGLHTAAVQLTGAPPFGATFNFFGGVITIAGGTTGQGLTEPVPIDDVDPGWAVLPNRGVTTWQEAHDASFWGATASYTCNYGAENSMTYTVPLGAAAIILMGGSSSRTHSFSVVVDGATHPLDISSSWRVAQPVVLFLKGGLDPSVSHMVEVVNFSADDGEAGVGLGEQGAPPEGMSVLGHRRFEIYKK